MYDDFYDDSFEFEQQIAEWKDTLKKAVKEEYQERMKRLEEENASLRDIKENWDQKVAELKEEKYKLRAATREAEDKAKKERLRGLLDSFTKIAWGYQYVELDDYRGKIKPTFEYAHSSNLDDYDRYTKIARVYNGEDFDKINDYYGMIFFDYGDCQRFCDYMNKKVLERLNK